MQMTEPRSVVQVWKEFGSLINTAIITFVALGGFVTLGMIYANNNNSIQNISAGLVRLETKEDDRWKEHSEYHKDRGEENARVITSLDGRIKSVEKEQGQYDRLSDKVAVTDSNLNSLASSVRDLVTKFNDYAGDLREMKVILQRMEKAQGNGK